MTIPHPDLQHEKRLGHPRARVAGVDEVGRGCIAGPVVAGVVVLPKVVDFKAVSWLSEIADSKLLVASKRKELAPLIRSWAQAWALGSASVEEIERINIYHASHLAMVRAIGALEVQPERVLVDGKFLPKDLPCPATAIVKGDLKCLSIAAASILAKVWRDQWMIEAHRTYSCYGFDSNKGYGTPEHLRALKENGACALHRKGFAPVAQSLQRGAHEQPTFPGFESL